MESSCHSLVRHFQCVHFDELSTDELYALLQLRQRVFVVEQTCPYLDADGQDGDAWHLMGCNEQGALLSYARLLGPHAAYEGYVSFGRVLTAPELRGRGEGRRLMAAILKELSRLFPDYPIKISAQAHLESFYSDFGFSSTGETYLEDDIPHIAMIAAL